MQKFPLLFKPFTISPVQLKNRITMAPLFTAYANLDGTVSSLILDLYQRIARGGAAMVVVANTVVDESGMLSRYGLRGDHDRFLPGLRQLAETIKAEGAVAVLQLNHGGRFSRGKTIYSPSAVSITDINFSRLYKAALRFQKFQHLWKILSEAYQKRAQRLREMTTKDILRIIRAYAEAAQRAKTAGFDMVEVHGGTGYLPVQFLSQRTNRRKDQYGGTLENRMRFPLELTQSIKAAVGSDYPVGYRFLADEWLRGGFSLDEARFFAKKLSQVPVAYLSVTGGTYESFFDPEIIEKSKTPGYMVYLAEQIKKVVELPVITAGHIISPDLGENILQQRKADLIGLARPLFADPLWPKKAQSGKQNTILPCKNCGACFQRVLTDQPAICSQWAKSELIKQKSIIRKMQQPLKKVLITMDGSENAVMGAVYAAEMLASRKDVQITILHIQTNDSSEVAEEIQKTLVLGRDILIEAGIPKETIRIQVQELKTTVAGDILEQIKDRGYHTVVLGRRGISRSRQILFGSVSNKVVQNSSHCTVWVVD